MDARDEDGPAPRAAVLVVDDYAPNLTAARALLEPIAEVTAVDSGSRAVEEIARRDYAVVVLDVNMPRMDGLEVARRIRSGRVNAHVPIIFLTAVDSDAEQILNGYAVGAVDYLRRPFESVILASKVSIFVELHQRREQAKREAATRARLQAERAAAEQASREKDQFLTMLSHELRTPLTSILLWSDMLLHKALPAETVRRGLETVDLCARHEAHMVENVLEMSRLVTGKLSLELSALDLDEVIADAVADVAGLALERQVTVHIAPAGPAPSRRALGDGPRLRKVLYNLFENAVTFTPAGGRVDVALEEGPAAFTIEVRDTGVGFPPELGPKLFSRFGMGRPAPEARARGGLGLGLAVAKELIGLHGGTIDAASEGAGRGASFTVTLPRPARPASGHGHGDGAAGGPS